MNATQTGALMRRCRELLTAGLITAKTFAAFDTMLWRLRVSGSDRMTAPYKKIMKFAGIKSRATLAAALTVLEYFGLIRRQPTKARVRGRWFQGINGYLFLPPVQEFNSRTAILRGLDIPSSLPVPREQDALQTALDRLGKAIKRGRDMADMATE